MTYRPFSADLRRIVSAVAISALVGSSGTALAEQSADAWLIQVQGTVLVDDGAGFVQVAGDKDLRLGDRVLVRDGGQAVLSYGTDCALPLEAPSMTTVTETACTVSTQGENGGGGGAAIVILGAAAAAGLLTWCIVDACKEDSASP